ncbi:hypothetical protein M407DRAFT_32733 [Tulasnella calospora MUT 4182]|uniref:Uncharacterized protein n=1 Tax=Tulasnella calospora MUT 4182 TaxID=1051891 RepID=A0A0C3PSA9_9AGAM|nr:hypothetical protein M407DRAFT_32733 [Tulasnella calospora MUT 4182]
MEKLWSDLNFQERFIDQWESSYSRMLQLRGHDQVEIATSSRRLYSAAAAHIILYRNTQWNEYNNLESSISSLRDISILIPESQIADSSTCLVRGSLAFTILQYSTYNRIFSQPRVDTNLLPCSLNFERLDWRLLCILYFTISEYPRLLWIWPHSLDSLRPAYRGENLSETFSKALEVLVRPESTEIPNRDLLLIKMVHWAHEMISTDNKQKAFTLELGFSLLKGCERILQSPRLPEAERQVIRTTRLSVSDIWQQECAVAARGQIWRSLPDVLEQYIAEVGTIHRAETGHHECVDILRVFGPSARQLLSYHGFDWGGSAQIRRFALIKAFNKFVQEVDQTSRQIQNNARRARYPDQRWCHWEEERVSIRATYSLPPDPPESDWRWVARTLGVFDEYFGPEE